MRKIEQNMINAIRAIADNGGGSWRSGNTEVRSDPVIGDIEIEIYLHGHLIAKKLTGNNWIINLCGWNTPTTRSRLSAIIREFSPSPPHHYDCGLGVSTRKGQARIHDARGITNINSNDWRKVVY